MASFTLREVMMDDVAPVARAQFVGRFTDQPHDAHDEQVVCVVPVLVGRLEERAARGAARGRHEVIDPAELVDRPRDEGGNIVRVGQIARLRDDAAVGDRRNLLAGRLEPVLVAAVEYDVRTLSCECFCRGFPRDRYSMP